jgi:hypothetical protein
MQSLECRFRGGRAFGELVLVVVLSYIVVTPFALDRHPLLADSPAFFIPGGAVSLLGVTLLFWRRWRSRFVVDERGVEFRRSAREVEEVFLLGWAEFEIRGAGRRLRLTGTHEDVSSAREMCARRMHLVREHLQARAHGEGKVVFRMPGGRWKAHLAYLLTVLVLTGITGLCLAPLLKRSLSGFPIFIVLFGGSWLWGLRKGASRLGTQVTLHRGGIEVRRLDGTDRVAWAELDHAEWNDKDGLDLVLRSHRVISLPSALGNIALLEEYVREGKAGVDSEAQGRPEDRTMMQSS